METSGSTRGSLSGLAGAAIGQPASASGCQEDSYRYENREEPGKGPGGTGVFGGYRTSVF